MRTARTTIGRSAMAAVVAIAVSLLLAGCLFDPAPPPDGSEAALTALTSKLNRLEGVASATGDVHQRDVKDAPNEWTADVRIRADTSDLHVAQEVRRVAARGVKGTSLLMTLEVPASRGIAGVTIDPMDSKLVALAEGLRKQDAVASATITSWLTEITVAHHVAYSDAVSRIRPLIGSGRATLLRGTASVEVTPNAPGAALLRVIDSLDAGGDATDLSYTAGTTYADSVGTTADRPWLSLVIRDPTAIAGTLAGTVDESADSELAPRTAFSARTENDAVEQGGWLGLPLDSAPPDDEQRVVKTPAPSPGTPGGPGSSAPPRDQWVPVDVDSQATALRAFLERSAAATTVGADVTTGIEQCSLPGRADLSGTRATARILVPIFTVYDDGQKPFDDVTALWRSEHLRQTDQAMGLQNWVPTPARGAVASATIRGTADGLSLTAESGCFG
jgi:hypothetical protein